MTYIEQHIIDHCKTANDVIQNAILVKQRRAAMWTKVDKIKPEKKTPILGELLAHSDRIMNEIDAELKRLGVDQNKIEVHVDPLPHEIQVSHINRYVARKFGVEAQDLKSERRSKEYVVPRQIVYLLARLLTTRSYPDIGRRMNRDHTTVIHGIHKNEWLRQKLCAELTAESPLSTWVNRAYELVKEHG